MQPKDKDCSQLAVLELMRNVPVKTHFPMGINVLGGIYVELTC